MTETSIRMIDDDTGITTLTAVDHRTQDQKTIDDSRQSTALYNKIHQLLFKSETRTDPDGTQHTIDVLRQDFNNLQLRNIISMLLLANDVKLKISGESQHISFEEQMDSKVVPYASLLSDLEIQADNLTFKFSKDTESFKKIKEIAQELQEENEDFNICFDTRGNIRQCVELVYQTSFTPDNNLYSDFILQIMLPIIYQLAFTGIQKTSPELIIKIISDNIIIQQIIAQIRQNALRNQRPLPELDLNNLLDENLIKVYDIAKLFIGSEGNVLTAEQQLKIVEIIEIARRTENPEVLKAIMEQECFKSNLYILSAIAENDKADAFTLSDCADAIRTIAKTFTGEENKMGAIETLSKIVQNPKADAHTLSNCANIIEYITETLTDEEKKEVIGIIFIIAQNPRADVGTLSSCVYDIGYIVKNLTDEDEIIKAIENMSAIFQNPRANWETLSDREKADVLSYCAETIEEIISTLKSKENKMKAIEIISTIIQNPEADARVLSSYACTIEKNAPIFTDDEKIEAIRIITSTIVQNLKANWKTLSDREKADILSYCTKAIIKIAPTLKYEDKKMETIITISVIAKNLGADVRKLPACVDTIGAIAKTLTDKNEKKQVVGIIFTIAQNNRADAEILHVCLDTIKAIVPNLTDEEKKKVIGIIFEIAQNPGADLGYCIDTIGAIAKTLTDKNEKKQVIGIIFRIVRNTETDIDTFYYCVGAIIKIVSTLTDEEKKEVIDIILFEIARNSRADVRTLSAYVHKIAETLTYEEKKEVIGIIFRIAQNPRADVETLDYCLGAIEDIAKTLTDDDKKMETIIAISKISQARTLFYIGAIACFALYFKNGDNKIEAINIIISTIIQDPESLTDEEKMVVIAIISEIAKNDKVDWLVLSSCADAIEKITETLEDTNLKEIANEISQIITEMKQSMQPNQTLQDMPEETKQQFFTDIQTKIDEMNQKIDEIREKEISEALAEPFGEPKQPNGSSLQVNAGVVPAATSAVVATGTPKTLIEEPEKPLVVGEHTAKLVVGEQHRMAILQGQQ